LASTSSELFREVERLADSFEPELCHVYADWFSGLIAENIPELKAAELMERYERVRRPRRFHRNPLSIDKVFVLSRVTLGADVAVTSVVLDGMKQAFENASIYFVGPEKNWDLFATDPGLEHLPIAYGRTSSLADRLAVWPELRDAVNQPRSIVVDPDSRLTQLGLLPVCPEENYFFFESRSYGAGCSVSLPRLTSLWVEETFGVPNAKAFIAPIEATGNAPDVTISLGVGENLAKRVSDPFEEELLRYIVRHEPTILVDRGAGGDEAARVERAAARSGGSLRLWDGSFAGFAARIKRSGLYIGYDSAGGHVAACCGVPMVSIFCGYPTERFLQRWRPSGTGPIHLIRATDPPSTLRQVIEALTAAAHA
jgi:ADP-heptose:LPS heptosyltransferase